MSSQQGQKYHTFKLPDFHDINKSLYADFMNHKDDVGVKRTHLFANRYENIYVGSELITELDSILNTAKNFAKQLLSVKKGLNTGCWFNYMPPGSKTLIHNHDDDDEHLSAVYYVQTADNSGNLLLHQNYEKITLTPTEGLFVFFASDVNHEVTENKSTSDRLSIGMNFCTQYG